MSSMQTELKGNYYAIGECHFAGSAIIKLLNQVFLHSYLL
jgi:hypothetical protein